ncbi:MAG: hypothetical protein ILP19_09785, partial [Oscillospiraceae bacterium]|nr:hypothetical protein [Oscillospiraceae bacterium]
SLYYVDGCPWFGWMKISGKWYYFSPEKGGNMATGTVETGAGTYRLAADGSWDGGITKIGKAPADFVVVYKQMRDDRYFEFDSSKKKLINAPSDSEIDKYTLDVNVTAKDVQIFYDMLTSCRVSELDSSVMNAGGDSFSVYAKYSGKELRIVANEGIYSGYSENANIRAIAYYTAFLEQYLTNLPQYAQSEQDRLNYASGAKFIDPAMATNIKDAKTKTYKGRFNIDTSAPRSDVVISSASEAKAFVNEYLYAKGVGKNGFASQLLAFDDSYFRKNVIVYTEAMLPEKAAVSLDKVTYDISTNTYNISIKAKFTESGNGSDYVMITEIPKPADASPVKPYAAAEIIPVK